MKILIRSPSTMPPTIEAEWTDIGMGVQKGDCNITVKLAIDCYDDTHYASGTADKIRERLQMNNKLYKLLQGFRNTKDMGSLKRLKSTDYAIHGGKKVYETTFRFTYHDNSAAIRQ